MVGPGTLEWWISNDPATPLPSSGLSVDRARELIAQDGATKYNIEQGAQKVRSGRFVQSTAVAACGELQEAQRGRVHSTGERESALDMLFGEQGVGETTEIYNRGRTMEQEGRAQLGEARSKKMSTKFN